MHARLARQARMAFGCLLAGTVAAAMAACADDDDDAPDAAMDAALDARPPDAGPPAPDARLDADPAEDAATPRVARILAFNDFHGAIAPGDARPGAGALAATIAMLRAEATDSIVVSAGDLVGASPLESGYWHDEPTIEAMNAVGLAINAVGNHELDEGPAEILRLVEGGRCHADGCGPFGAHDGASFEMLAANTFTDEIGGETLFAPYVVRELGGARVAFVGLTLERTRSIAAGAATLAFGDEADTVNALVPELTAMGIETVVVLVHEGGAQIGGPSGCDGLSGAIVGIVERMDPEIDLVISGHTHESYLCELDGRVVTSAGANGLFVTSIDLELDETGELAHAVATNVEVPLDMAPEPTVAAVVDAWVEATRDVRERRVGTVTATLRREGPETCNFIADAMLEAGAALGSAVDFAFMNLGGIRASIPYAPPGAVTFGELYDVHPFGNRIVVLSLTGAEVVAALDEGPRPLCPSSRLAYRWSAARTGPEPDSVRLDDAPIDPAATYRVVVSDYNFAGGEGYTVFNERGTDTMAGGLVVDAMERFLAAHDVAIAAITRPVSG
ncbi:MAG: bifunctional metallophosphatase/5'-nucleotidase [Deltaproteobacteria bacterium]|nr:bifunctional metallophosphatase/5'-nucleotidase [Deltaproteobacteria bacterium]